MASPLIAQVRAADLSRVGILSDDDLATLKVFPVRNGVGTWELKLPHMVRSASGKWVRHAMAEELAKPGAGIIIDLPGGRRVTGPVVTPTYTESSDEPRGSWAFAGVTDAIILADRLAFPDPTMADAQSASNSRAYDVRSGAAEFVMRSYVKANLVDSPTERRAPRFRLGAVNARGRQVTKSARFTTLLELCQELAAPDGLLFDVVQVGDMLEFQTTVPADLSGDIRLDVHADSLDSAKWASSGPAASDVIVLGGGEGEARVIRTRTTPEAQALAAAYGRRIEVAVDARGAELVAELDAKGDEVLAANGSRIDSLELIPTAVNTRELGLKWWVGDIVTINVAGQPVKASVASAAIESTPDGLFATAKVGDSTGFDPDASTGARLSGVEGRVSNLERTAEASAGGDSGTVELPPVMPAPASIVGSATNSITTTVAFNEAVPGMKIDMTFPKPAYVLVTASGWIQSAGGDTRAGVKVSGATTLPPQDRTEGSAAWGEVMWSTNSYEQRSLQRIVRVNPGTTTFTLAAYRLNTSTTASVNYPVITVTPLYWEGMVPPLSSVKPYAIASYSGTANAGNTAAAPPWNAVRLEGNITRSGGVFTMPRSGLVSVSGLYTLALETTAPGNAYAAVFHNGNAVMQGGTRLVQNGSAGASWSQPLSGIVPVAAGDTLEWRVRAQVASPMVGSAQHNYFHINYAD